MGTAAHLRVAHQRAIHLSSYHQEAEGLRGHLELVWGEGMSREEHEAPVEGQTPDPEIGPLKHFLPEGERLESDRISSSTARGTGSFLKARTLRRDSRASSIVVAREPAAKGRAPRAAVVKARLQCSCFSLLR